MKRKHPQRSPRPAPRPDRKPPRHRERFAPRPSEASPKSTPPGREFHAKTDSWIYGVHAALAAIANPARMIRQILVAQESAPELASRLATARASRGSPSPDAVHVPRQDLERALPRGAVHQGIAVATGDLTALDLDDLIRTLDGRATVRVVVLDQVTDPHNVGAILRSAAAFGVAAVVMPERNAPGASAVMAKAASGAMERVPLVRVVNLARAIDALKAANVWCIGLAGDAPQSLLDSDLSGRIAIVLGAEGEGLRRLTRERCDALAHIPIANDAVESLNVSNAAAIALYELARRR